MLTHVFKSLPQLRWKYRERGTLALIIQDHPRVGHGMKQTIRCINVLTPRSEQSVWMVSRALNLDLHFIRTSRHIRPRPCEVQGTCNRCLSLQWHGCCWATVLPPRKMGNDGTGPSTCVAKRRNWSRWPSSCTRPSRIPCVFVSSRLLSFMLEAMGLMVGSGWDGIKGWSGCWRCKGRLGIGQEMFEKLCKCIISDNIRDIHIEKWHWWKQVRSWDFCLCILKAGAPLTSPSSWNGKVDPCKEPHGSCNSTKAMLFRSFKSLPRWSNLPFPGVLRLHHQLRRQCSRYQFHHGKQRTVMSLASEEVLGWTLRMMCQCHHLHLLRRIPQDLHPSCWGWKA